MSSEASPEVGFHVSYEWYQFDEVWVTAKERFTTAEEVVAEMANLRQAAEEGCIRNIQVTIG